MTTLALFFLFSKSFADDRQRALVECARTIAPRTPGRLVTTGAGGAIVADATDGWALRAFEDQIAYRCALPAAVEACFRSNSKCPAFDFLIAQPGAGARVGFDGAGIDDHARTDRLTTYEPLARGTVDENGRIKTVIRAPKNPTLGLKCVVDRGPAALAALEVALRGELAGAAKVGAACAGLARPPAPPAPSTPPAATAR